MRGVRERMGRTLLEGDDLDPDGAAPRVEDLCNLGRDLIDGDDVFEGDGGVGALELEEGGDMLKGAERHWEMGMVDAGEDR